MIAAIANVCLTASAAVNPGFGNFRGDDDANRKLNGYLSPMSANVALIRNQIIRGDDAALAPESARARKLNRKAPLPNFTKHRLARKLKGTGLARSFNGYEDQCWRLDGNNDALCFAANGPRGPKGPKWQLLVGYGRGTGQSCGTPCTDCGDVECFDGDAVALESLVLIL